MSKLPRHFFAGLALLLLVSHVWLVVVTFRATATAKLAEVLAADTRITGDSAELPIRAKYFEIAENDFTLVLQPLPKSVWGTKGSVESQTALESEFFTRRIESPGAWWHGNGYVFLGVVVLGLVSTVGLAVGIGMVLYNSLDRSCGLRDRIDDITRGLAICALPLLFFLPVMTVCLNRTTLYVDNATDAEYALSVDGAVAIPLPGRSHVRLTLLPGGLLAPRLGEKSLALAVFKKGDGASPFETAVVRVLPRRCYVYNLSATNSYYVRSGLFQ